MVGIPSSTTTTEEEDGFNREARRVREVYASPLSRDEEGEEEDEDCASKSPCASVTVTVTLSTKGGRDVTEVPLLPVVVICRI